MLAALTQALGVHDLALFSVTVLVLNATPGVDLLYTVSRTLGGGARAGVAASLGISTGCAVHALLAAAGLAALLAVSPWAFALIKWAGAAYLAWLAAGMLRQAGRPAAAGPVSALTPATWGVVFRQGLLTNLLNPKVALFVLAFLPQFIRPGVAHPTAAFLLLGAVLVAQGMLFLLAVVGLASRLRRLGGSPRVARAMQAAGGLLFVGLAARLALSEAG